MPENEINFISNFRQEIANAIRLLNNLHAIVREAEAMGYPNALSDDAFTGTHTGLTKSDVAAAYAVVSVVLQTLGPEARAMIYKVKA